MSAARKPIIGIAGGIGSGKSAVAKILAELGCVVSESDVAARAALRDPHIKNSIVKKWGKELLDESGEVNRSKLASIVFSDPKARKQLEGLTHPWIEARRKEAFAKAPASAQALIIDAPLLFEAGLDAICDAVIFVDADREIRLLRVISGRNWDAGELTRRENSQMPLDEKRRRADYVVENNGDLSELNVRVRPILKQIVDSCRQ